MKLSNFEQYIEPRIIERGKEYWESGCVSKIRWEDESIAANVRGRNLYKVEIDLVDSKIDDVYCDCPYDWDDYCKHVVAVLFALKNDGIPESDQEALDEIIQTMDPEEMRSLLGEILSKEPQWRERIIARSVTGADEIFRRYNTLLEERIYACSDRYGYIGYNQAYDVGCIGDDILAEVEMLITDGEFEQAFAISRAVLLNMNEAIKQADDSNGYIGDAVQNAMNCLRELAATPNVPNDIQDALFEFLTDVDTLNKFADFGWHHDLQEIAVGMADSASREKRLFSADRLQIEENDEEVSDYAFSQQQQLRLAWLTKFASASDVEHFINENIDLPEFRKMKLEQLYNEGQYGEVIRIARLGVKQDFKLRGLVRDWREWILKGAEGKKDIDLQREVLEEMYESSYELQYYKALKGTYLASDWSEIRQKILQSFNGSWRAKADVLIEERMTEDLWNLVLEKISFDVLSEYDRYLLPAYIDEIRDYYTRLIPEFLDQAVGRTHYHRVAGLLYSRKKLLGTRFCDNLVHYLLQMYPHRPAMRDEFRMAGLVKKESGKHEHPSLPL